MKIEAFKTFFVVQKSNIIYSFLFFNDVQESFFHF